MFEEKTFDNIMSEMLNNVSGDVDKREGSIVYDALAPVAIELAQAYSDFDFLVDETFADTASYYYLIKRAAERGVFVKTGNTAVLKIRAKPTTVSIPVGCMMFIGDMQYTITESLGNGLYSMTCTENGPEGNNVAEDIIPSESIEGLEGVSYVETIIPGTENETVDALRNRYYASFQANEFSGNIADYKEKTKNIPGVGACKVHPTWNGGGTVKLVILNSQCKVASSELVMLVQETIDPTQDGQGMGLAPIGHEVTVETATATIINITANIELDAGYTLDDVRSSINSAVDNYFNVLAEKWENEKNVIVRLSKIETAILSVTGVSDIGTVTINSTAKNISLDPNCIPIRGDCKWIEKL